MNSDRHARRVLYTGTAHGHCCSVPFLVSSYPEFSLVWDRAKKRGQPFPHEADLAEQAAGRTALAAVVDILLHPAHRHDGPAGAKQQVVRDGGHDHPARQHAPALLDQHVTGRDQRAQDHPHVRPVWDALDRRMRPLVFVMQVLREAVAGDEVERVRLAPLHLGEAPLCIRRARCARRQDPSARVVRPVHGRMRFRTGRIHSEAQR